MSWICTEMKNRRHENQPIRKKDFGTILNFSKRKIEMADTILENFKISQLLGKCRLKLWNDSILCQYSHDQKYIQEQILMWMWGRGLLQAVSGKDIIPFSDLTWIL